MQPATNQNISLSEWTRRISEEEMPVFAHTATSIASASSGDETSIASLSHLILRDSTMTARILRLANSAVYNPGNRRINTISRAIVLLGFNVVRSMALSIAILDPLLKGIQHEHALKEMARSFHAAVQARNIAFQRKSNDPEAVFVAALLSRLGNMAFWCFPYGFAKKLDAAYLEWEQPAKAEDAVLGFSLKQLTMSLNNEWKLSTLLAEYFKGLNKDDAVMKDLDYANNLIMAVEQGWGGINTRDCIQKIADHIEFTFDETNTLVEECAHEAARTAAEFGAEAVSQLIPLPKLDDASELVFEAENEPQARHTLQMEILRELTTMLHEKADLNAILGTIIEGIYRALGMERTVLAFISPKDSMLMAKYTLGDAEERLKQCFCFSTTEKNIFAALMRSNSAFWLNDKTRGAMNPLITDSVKTCLNTLEFFCIPITVNGQGRGLIYADCKRSGRPLSADEFQTFTTFGEYASIAFDLMTSNTGK
ncbi:Predicted signal transduction protein [hydrothermal vent metagenome]|uniref:Predicted signal transduction protein n=1 Tax=hydrothermal vent metagenome TaxID=652676 RepID=A0A3B1A4D7_9ZZZZ